MSKKPDLLPESKIQTLGMVLILLVILLMLKATKSDAQSISSTVFTEKTVMGQQIGAMTGYHLKNGPYIGAFYQKNINNLSEISAHGYELAGLILSMPIIGKKDVSISPSMRIGLSDRSSVVIVPGISAIARVTNQFSLLFGSSIRASEATMSLGVSVDLITRAKNHRPRYR